MNLIITAREIKLDSNKLTIENLKRVIRSYHSDFEKIIIALDTEYTDSDNAHKLINLGDNLELCFVGNTKGALCTALLCIESLSEATPLFIAPGDSLSKAGYMREIQEFIESDYVAGTALVERRDKSWSFVRTKNNSEIIEISEKRIISNLATTGFFMFRDLESFLSGATWAISNRVEVNQKYYLSGAIQALLVKNYKVKGYPISEEEFESYRQSSTN